MTDGNSSGQSRRCLNCGTPAPGNFCPECGQATAAAPRSLTFLLIALLAEARLPAALANAMSLWVIACFTIALMRVYGGTWTETLVRGSVILALYFAIFFVANLLLILALLAL